MFKEHWCFVQRAPRIWNEFHAFVEDREVAPLFFGNGFDDGDVRVDGAVGNVEAGGQHADGNECPGDVERSGGFGKSGWFETVAVGINERFRDGSVGPLQTEQMEVGVDEADRGNAADDGSDQSELAELRRHAIVDSIIDRRLEVLFDVGEEEEVGGR